MKSQENTALRKKIGLFFDNELDSQSQSVFINKIEQDPQLKYTFDREKSVRELLKNSVQRTCVSPDVIRSIKQRIKFG